MSKLLLKGLVASLLLAAAGGQHYTFAQAAASTATTGTCVLTVVDNEGEPVIGATVRVAGTTIAGMTNLDGVINLNGVKNGAKINVTAVGFEPVSGVWDGSPLRLVMTLADNALDEVVVVGYGVQKKANLTGSVASINAEALESRSVSSISSAMTGQMPGVTVIQTSGAPGAQNGSITVRGNNTLNSASVLTIVDGVPGSINNIDPQDVESISVLKDAASAAIYGVQAANGVILVTTKKGRLDEKAKVNYSGTVSWVSPTNRLHFVDAATYATMYNQAQIYGGTSPENVSYTPEDIELYRNGKDPYDHPNTDWYHEVFKKHAVETQHSIAIQGGSRNTTYMASLAYLYQEGLSQEKNYERFNGRINLDSKVASWVSLGINASAYRGINKDDNESFNSLQQYVNRNNSTFPVYEVIRDENGKGVGFSDEFAYRINHNPLAFANGRSGFSKTIDDQLHVNAYLNLTPIEGLSVKGLFSWRHDHRDTSSFKKIIEYGTYSSGQRQGAHNFYNWDWYTYQLIANYMKTIGKHEFNILAGAEAVKYDYRYTTTSRKGGGTDDLTVLDTLDSGSQTNSDGGQSMTRQSYFGRIQYDFAGRYLFEANFRADASSRFPKDSRWGYFPAFSAGWRIMEESFMENTRTWLSNLKLRLGWGRTGNEEISEYYPAVATYSFMAWPMDGSLYTTTYESRYVNNKLKWATVTNWELGLDAGFLNNRFGFELSLYRKKTNDMLMNLAILDVIGMSAPDQNAGSVENKGIELALFHNNRINKDFSYAVNLNISHNENKILSLVGTENIHGNYIDREGESIGSYYGYEVIGMFKDEDDVKNSPVRTGKEMPGNLKYRDINNDGKIDANDRTIIGRNFPSWTAGLNITAFYRDFDLSMLWQGAFDVDNMFTGEAIYSFYNSGDALDWTTDYWTPTNQNAKYPRLTTNASGSVDATVNSFWLQDASYVRLKSLVFGYTIPKHITGKIGIEKVRVFFNGENLFTFSHLNDKHLDPETPTDNRGAFYSNVKKLSLGLKVTF